MRICGSVGFMFKGLSRYLSAALLTHYLVEIVFVTWIMTIILILILQSKGFQKRYGTVVFNQFVRAFVEYLFFFLECKCFI